MNIELGIKYQVIDLGDYRIWAYTGNGSFLYMSLFHMCTVFMTEYTNASFENEKCYHCEAEIPKDVLAILAMSTNYMEYKTYYNQSRS